MCVCVFVFVCLFVCVCVCACLCESLCVSVPHCDSWCSIYVCMYCMCSDQYELWITGWRRAGADADRCRRKLHRSSVRCFCMYVCMCVCVCMCACVHVCMCVCVYVCVLCVCVCSISLEVFSLVFVCLRLCWCDLYEYVDVLRIQSRCSRPHQFPLASLTFSLTRIHTPAHTLVHTTTHATGLFFRTIKMAELGLKPVYVFDGKTQHISN